MFLQNNVSCASFKSFIEMLGISRGLIDYLILTVKQLCAVPDAYKLASVLAVVPLSVHDLKLK